MAGIFVPIAGDPTRLLRAFKQSSDAADVLDRDLKQLGLTAQQSAEKQIAAATRRDARLRQELQSYRQIAATAKAGSREQVVAANLATQAEGRLARSLGVTTSEARQHERALRGAQGELSKFGRGAIAGSGAARGFARSLAFASGTFLGGAGLIAGVRASIKAASNLNEQTTKSRQVFDDSSASVEKWARTTVGSLGLAEDQALETASSFGALLRPVGLTGDQAAAQSKRLTQLGADLASFYNTSVQDALDAIRSGIVGESEPLRRYGVLLTETRVAQEALRQTGKRHATQLTAQEKVLARIALVTRDAALADGDFARTSGGLANQQRILEARLRQTEIVIGKALIPSTLEVVQRINTWLSSSRNQARIQRDVTQAVTAGTAAVKGIAAGLEVAHAALSPFVRLLGGAENAATVATVAFVGLRIKALAAAVGITRAGIAAAYTGRQAEAAAGKVGLLSGRLRGLPTRIAIGVVLGIEAYGPAKKLFEKLFGADYTGTQTPPPGDVNDRERAQAIRRARALRRAGNANKAIRAQLFREGFSQNAVQAALNQITPTGEDVGLRGAGARTGGAAATRTVPGPLGFRARFANLELKRAQAELTATEADDRKILVAERNLIAARIRTLGRSRKTLAERTELTQQLAGIDQDIAAIDEAGARARSDAAKRQQAAAKRRRDAAAKALKAEGDELADDRRRAETRLRTIRAREKNLRDDIKQITSAFRDAVDRARSGIGELFGGPVLNFDEDQRRAALGIPNTAADPRALTRDLNAQVAQASAFQRNLTRLGKRGASKALLADLAAGGMANATEVAALAGADKATLNAFLRAYTKREKLAQTIARAEMKVQLAHLHADRIQLGKLHRQEVKVEVTIKGIRKDQYEVKVKQSAAQRRGPAPGKTGG